MAQLPGSPILWIGAGLISPIIGLFVSITFSTILVIFAAPLVFFGIFSFGVAFVKHSHTKQVEDKIQSREQNLLLDNKNTLLRILENKSETWTFEKLSDVTKLSQEDLLIALKACVDEKQVEEELDTSTGDWYYVWQEPQKELVRPKSLDERLQEINKN